jgi:hypothetical protein
VEKSRRKLTLDEFGILIAVAAVIFGGLVYLYPPSAAGFPINDGGLFYSMIRAIQENGYRLPETVQYNGLSIPFAYPPLAFYVGALVSSLLHVDPVQVLRWLPAVVLIAVSVVFYMLAGQILGSPFKAGIATFLYVCLPRSMTWLIMGGGLTRSLGHLFLVLTLISVSRLLTRRTRKNLACSILFGALVVLTHPEATLHTIAIAILLWAFGSRSRQSMLDFTLIGLGVAVLSAAWWLPIVLRLGFAPFSSAFQTGLHASAVFAFPLLLTFGEEPLTSLVAVLGLIGLIGAFARKQYLILAWIILPFAVEPRGAANISILPLALAGSIALSDIILPAIADLEATYRARKFESIFGSVGVRALLSYLGFFLLQYALFAGAQLARIVVSAPNRLAFQWVADHASPLSRFLVLTGDIELYCDPVEEWFPALTGRESLTTIQGLEWTSTGNFFVREGQFQQIQACVHADSPLQCIKDNTASLPSTYDYIYVSKAAPLKRFCRPLADQRRGAALMKELLADSHYRSVYESADVAVFELRAWAIKHGTEAVKANAIAMNHVKDSVSRK